MAHCPSHPAASVSKRCYSADWELHLSARADANYVDDRANGSGHHCTAEQEESAEEAVGAVIDPTCKVGRTDSHIIQISLFSKAGARDATFGRGPARVP